MKKVQHSVCWWKPHHHYHHITKIIAFTANHTHKNALLFFSTFPLLLSFVFCTLVLSSLFLLLDSWFDVADCWKGYFCMFGTLGGWNNFTQLFLKSYLISCEKIKKKREYCIERPCLLATVAITIIRCRVSSCLFPHFVLSMSLKIISVQSTDGMTTVVVVEKTRQRRKLLLSWSSSEKIIPLLWFHSIYYFPVTWRSWYWLVSFPLLAHLIIIIQSLVSKLTGAFTYHWFKL